MNFPETAEVRICDSTAGCSARLDQVRLMSKVVASRSLNYYCEFALQRKLSYRLAHFLVAWNSFVKDFTIMFSVLYFLNLVERRSRRWLFHEQRRYKCLFRNASLGYFMHY